MRIALNRLAFCQGAAAVQQLRSTDGYKVGGRPELCQTAAASSYVFFLNGDLPQHFVFSVDQVTLEPETQQNNHMRTT